jgi:nucleotide-binding universal stress UspA family protein
MYRRILVPIDGSPCSDLVVSHGLAIARAMGGAVMFLFVMDTLSAYHEGVVSVADARDALTVEGRGIVGRALNAAQDAGVGAECELVEGTPAEVIAQRAAYFDLVVMGSHGKGFFKRITMGSVTEAVLHRVTRPLLVVRCPLEAK